MTLSGCLGEQCHEASSERIHQDNISSLGTYSRLQKAVSSPV